jgi:hypothetical protein
MDSFCRMQPLTRDWKLIWAFQIEEAYDADRKAVEPTLDPRTGYSEGFLVCAKEFGCQVTLR